MQQMAGCMEAYWWKTSKSWNFMCTACFFFLKDDLFSRKTAWLWNC